MSKTFNEVLNNMYNDLTIEFTDDDKNINITEFNTNERYIKIPVFINGRKVKKVKENAGNTINNPHLSFIEVPTNITINKNAFGPDVMVKFYSENDTLSYIKDTINIISEHTMNISSYGNIITGYEEYIGDFVVLISDTKIKFMIVNDDIIKRSYELSSIEGLSNLLSYINMKKREYAVQREIAEDYYEEVDPVIEHKVNEMAKRSEFQKMFKTLVDYHVQEYAMDHEKESETYINGLYLSLMEEFKHDGMAGIAYTTLGDNEEISVEIFLNLLPLELECVYSGKNVRDTEIFPFDNFNEVTEMFEIISFEDLVYPQELDIDELILKDKHNENTKVNDLPF